MKFELVDKFGRETTIYVKDNLEPILVDDQNRPVIDFQGLFPQPRTLPLKTDPGFKSIVDAFLQRPSPGVSDWWISEGTYETSLPGWRQALFLLTGKMLIRASK